MNNKSLIIPLILAVIVLSAIIIVKEGANPQGGRNPPPEITERNIGKVWVDKDGVTNIVVKANSVMDGKEPNAVITNKSVELAPVRRAVERRPLEPEATKRLHDGPVIVKSVFEASGKAEFAQYGGVMRGSYLYTTTVMAQSEIQEKYEDKETGRVRVEERRKFLQSRDALSLSELDAAIALNTLPVDQVQQWANGVCHIVSSICTAIAPIIPPAAPWLLIAGRGAEAANAAVNASFETLNMIDGVGVRGLLGVFGVKIPESLEQFASERIAKIALDKVRDVHNAIQSIEGKSFMITYDQEKNGSPLNVDYRNEDGKPITDAEWEILRSANAFLDANVVSDTRCRVGDTWTVWADEVQELFGCAGNGRAEGKIRIERVDDQKDGTWTLKVEPTTIEFRSDDGTTAGKMKVKDGNGLVDGANASVKSLHATADGNLRSLNKKRHFMFFDFVKRLNGDSNLRFTLTAEPARNLGLK